MNNIYDHLILEYLSKSTIYLKNNQFDMIDLLINSISYLDYDWIQGDKYLDFVLNISFNNFMNDPSHPLNFLITI